MFLCYTYINDYILWILMEAQFPFHCQKCANLNMNIPNKKYADTLIISDIHLGSDLCRAKELINIIKKYNFKRLILNGDIFDSLNLKRLHTEHWALLTFIRKISKKNEVIWIIGNHDGRLVELSELLGVKMYRKYSWRSNGKKFLAIHGHQFDRFLNKNIILSGIAVSFYNIIQKIDTKNRVISRWIKNTNKSWLRLSEEVARGAILYAKMNGADYIFCGHTHITKYAESKGIKYYNSGCWVLIPSNYITIDNNDVKIIDVK